MLVETVPVGEACPSPVVAGRIGPETDTLETESTSQTAEASADSVEVSQTVPEAESPAAEEPAARSEEDKEQQEKLFWAEIELLGKLSTAVDTSIEAEEEFKSAEERQKELKAELSELNEEVSELREALNEARTAVLDISRDIHGLIRHKKLPTPPASQSASAIDDAEDAQDAVAAVDPDAWKHLATTELLKGVKGLGATKLTAICELAPTVGDLESLRGEASKEHKQFKDKLPKGCGQAVADIIEDRLVSHIATCAKEAAGAAGKPDTSLADEIVAALRNLASNESWRPEDCQPDEHDTDMIKQGRAAFAAGKPYTALPTLDPQLAHQWMVGWVCGEVIAAHAAGPKASSGSEAN